jgi:hypothetical protein
MNIQPLLDGYATMRMQGSTPDVLYVRPAVFDELKRLAAFRFDNESLAESLDMGFRIEKSETMGGPGVPMGMFVDIETLTVYTIKWNSNDDPVLRESASTTH